MRVVRAAGWGLLALARFVAAATPQLPLRPVFFEASLDPASPRSSTMRRQPADARPRLISTPGPLGFTSYTFYLPETYPRLLAVHAVLSLVLCTALGWLELGGMGIAVGRGIVLLASWPLLGDGDVRGLLFIGLLPLIELVPCRPPPTSLRVALGVAVGLMAISKVTFVVRRRALVTLGPLSVSALRRGACHGRAGDAGRDRR